MEKELEEIRELLKEKLDSENGNITRRQMAECEAWLAYISHQYRERKRILAQKSLQALPPKEKGTTELDRQITLEALIAPLQQDVDVLRDLMSIIQQRITTGQSFLKSMQTEIERGL
jgi:hypothetical protein